MSKLPVHNYADIKALNPCYDPVERGYMTADQTITALDVLRRSDVLSWERLWLVLRDGWVPDQILHEFAVWCEEQAIALIDDPDPRIVFALNVRRRRIDGLASDYEIDAADAAAYDARMAACSAWYVDTREAQVTHLITLLEAYEAEQ